ncbi:hypothetical protein JCM8547_002375 [Rhodosporidiobolus lusitaniae]
MVRLCNCALFALALAPAASANPLAALSNAGQGVLKFGLTKLGFNATVVDKILKAEVADLDKHDHAVDLTDENFATVLATGTDNPFAPALGEDDVWVITVHGPDPVSKPFIEGMNDVATYNASSAGGTLPENLHLARLSYAKETVLPTKWWLWRTPVIVIGTNKMQKLRFIRPGQVRPNVFDLSQLLARPDVWENAPVWEGSFAPGGKYESYLEQVARSWARFHKFSSNVPQFALLALSGFVGNFVLAYFHKSDPAAEKAKAEAGSAGGAAKARLGHAQRLPSLPSKPNEPSSKCLLSFVTFLRQAQRGEAVVAFSLFLPSPSFSSTPSFASSSRAE